MVIFYNIYFRFPTSLVYAYVPTDSIRNDFLHFLRGAVILSLAVAIFSSFLEIVNIQGNGKHGHPTMPSWQWRRVLCKSMSQSRLGGWKTLSFCVYACVYGIHDSDDDTLRNIPLTWVLQDVGFQSSFINHGWQRFTSIYFGLFKHTTNRSWSMWWHVCSFSKGRKGLNSLYYHWFGGI